jgi:nucleotide-binding universal stress UspA family protein
MFRTILIPVDIDDVETSRPALDKAVALAEASGGSIRLIYVRSLVPVTFMEFVPPNFDMEQQAEAQKRLAALAQDIRLPKERVSTVVTLGGVYHDVLQEADKIGADLVVVGSRGARGLRRMLLGSVARGVVAEAESSVLVVRPPVAAAPDAIGRDEARERSVIPA